MSLITTIDIWTVRIPLSTPVTFGALTYTDRDYTVVRLTTADGERGFAYCMGRNAPLAATARALAPIAIGTDPRATQQRWDTMYSATIPFGQRGLALRALSLYDIAGWDLVGRIAGVPVHGLLGTARVEIPLAVGGGYFRESRDPADIREELSSYVERGFGLIKVPAGGGSANTEEQWVASIRDVIGDSTDLGIDAHWTWRDPYTAASVLKRLDPYRLAWVEDPLWPEAIRELAVLRSRIRSPLAVGDELSGRWVYRDIASAGAADIFRVDITTVGGFTEFTRVAALAETFGIPISTHVYPEMHVHCAASREIVRWTEYVDAEAEIDMSHRFIDGPMSAQNGMTSAPLGAGLGFDLAWEWIEENATERFSLSQDDTA